MSKTSKLMEKYKSRKTTEITELGENDARIVFNCREGSVSHYYHFLYGALIPLIEFHINNPDKRLLITTNVGPFEYMLRELFGDVIIGFENPVIPPGAEYFDDKSMNYVRTKFPDEIILPAYDLFNTKIYNNSKSRDLLRRLDELKPIVNNFIELKMPDKYKDIETFDILLIQRDVDEYYVDKRLENRDFKRDIFYTSGKQRRDVLNHRQMTSELKQLFGSKINNVILEKKSLFYQYKLFKDASIVIGQHGAALGNIFFMNPNSNLLEIMSPWGREGNHFSNLAHHLHINYGHVFMESDIDNVNIPELMRISERMYRPNRRSPTRRSPSRRSPTRKSSPRRSPSRRSPSRRSPSRRSPSRRSPTRKYKSSSRRSPSRSLSRSSSRRSPDRTRKNRNRSGSPRRNENRSYRRDRSGSPRRNENRSYRRDRSGSPRRNENRNYKRDRSGSPRRNENRSYKRDRSGSPRRNENRSYRDKY